MAWIGRHRRPDKEQINHLAGPRQIGLAHLVGNAFQMHSDSIALLGGQRRQERSPVHATRPGVVIGRDPIDQLLSQFSGRPGWRTIFVSSWVRRPVVRRL